MSAVLSWLWGLVPLDKAALAGCAALAILAGWFYVSMTNARADAAMLRADNSRLLDSASAKNAALAVLQREKAGLETIIAKRDSRISELNAAAIDAATAIMGAKSENPNQGLDAVLPRALSDPLRVLATKANGRDRAAGGSAASSRVSVSAEANAGTSGGNDRQKPRGVDGKAYNVGSRNERRQGIAGGMGQGGAK